MLSELACLHGVSSSAITAMPFHATAHLIDAMSLCATDRRSAAAYGRSGHFTEGKKDVARQPDDLSHALCGLRRRPMADAFD